VKALGFRLPPRQVNLNAFSLPALAPKKRLLLIICPVTSSLKPKQRDAVVPGVVVHGPVVRAKVNRTAVFVSRAVGGDRSTEGNGRHISDMSLQVLECTIDWVKLYGRREPYPDVTIQVSTMLVKSIQEESDRPKRSFGVVPWSSVATAMRWAKRFSDRNTGKVKSALFTKGSIFLVANFHSGHNGRVLDQHPPEQGQAPVEDSVADAVIFPLLCSDASEGIGRMLRVGRYGLSDANTKPCSLSLSKGRCFAPIKSQRKDERLYYSLLGLKGPRHGDEFSDQSLRPPHSCRKGGTRQLSLSAKMAPQVPRVVDDLDSGVEGVPVVHLQPEA
jgi:hypothetical protein